MGCRTAAKRCGRRTEVQGVIKAIGGIVLVVVGVACIAASLGAATPAVVAAGTMIGSGTTVLELQIQPKGHRMFIMEVLVILTVRL